MSDLNSRLRSAIKDYRSNDLNYDMYQEELIDLANEYPKEFKKLQQYNTNKRNEMLNTLAFDMDAWNRDPISKSGLKDFEFKANIPYGYANSDLLPDWLAGFYSKNDKVAQFAGNESINPATLRHEASHSVLNTIGEEPLVRYLDEVYAQANKNKSEERSASRYIDRVNSYNKSYSDRNFLFNKAMDSSTELLGGYNDNATKVDAYDWNLDWMSPEQKLNLLNRANEFISLHKYGNNKP